MSCVLSYYPFFPVPYLVLLWGPSIVLGLVQSTLALRRRLSFVSWYCCRLQIRFSHHICWVIRCCRVSLTITEGPIYSGNSTPFIQRETWRPLFSSRWRCSICLLKRNSENRGLALILPRREKLSICFGEGGNRTRISGFVGRRSPTVLAGPGLKNKI